MTTPRNDGLPELLPCPFCGLDVTKDEGCFPVNREKTSWEVSCGNPACFGHWPDAPTREEAIAKWNRRGSPSVGGVRVPDALSEHPRSSSYDQGWADGFTHCRAEVLRLNPAAEVGVMVGNVPIAAKIMSFLQIEPGVCLDDAGINPANLARAITLANTYKDARDEIDQHKAPENRTNDTDCIEAAALLRRLAGSEKEMNR